MNELFIGIGGGVVIFVGLGISLTRGNSASQLPAASTYSPAPEGFIHPIHKRMRQSDPHVFGVAMVVIAIFPGILVLRLGF